MTTAGADKGQAAESSQKRKREDRRIDAEKGVKRKYNLDADILECPICLEQFSPPVYQSLISDYAMSAALRTCQCHNGHTACAACCENLKSKKCPTCSLPTGSIRSIAIEKIVESLLVSCKYARHGCEEMTRPTCTESHELSCFHEPFKCPITECVFEGTSDVLLLHLAESHQVRTIHHDNVTPQWFRMEPLDRIVMVKMKIVEAGDIPQETYPIYLVHREVHDALGDVFFCTVLEGPYDSERYNLQVKPAADYNVDIRGLYSVQEAEAYIGHKRYHWSEADLDFLLVPRNKRVVKFSYSLCFKITGRFDYD